MIWRRNGGHSLPARSNSLHSLKQISFFIRSFFIIPRSLPGFIGEIRGIACRTIAEARFNRLSKVQMGSDAYHPGILRTGQIHGRERAGQGGIDKLNIRGHLQPGRKRGIVKSFEDGVLGASRFNFRKNSWLINSAVLPFTFIWQFLNIQSGPLGSEGLF
jgi:hypothetical protein